jgi:hypothetical protein
MANTYLTKTFSGNGSATTHTLSMWVKRGNMDSMQKIFFIGAGSNQHQVYFAHYPAGGMYNNLQYEFYNGTNNYYIRTNRRFQDTNSWYHIVAVWDTTNATSGDRMRLYVNGVRETSFAAEAQPTQNFNGYCNQSTYAYRIGASDSGQNFDGLISHLHSIDGTVYDASTFGSTDSVTGEWKINTSPSITMGTNGFTILKDGNTITDQSTNSNDFTLGGGTLTNTEDCPSNVFATYNPLDNYYANSTFSNGNTTIVTNSGNTTYNTSTLGIPPTMKCYWEAKFDTVQSANGEVGIVNTPTTGSAAGAYRLYYQTYGISVNDGGAIWSANANTGITLGTLTTSDIVCFAWDGVNQALYVRKNGDAWINSGDPTSGASKTGAVKSFSGTSLTMFPAVGDQSGSHAVGTSTNFGNGYFGTTAISSEGTNASGNGKFEYNVPNGYTALSTKGLNL